MPLAMALATTAGLWQPGGWLLSGGARAGPGWPAHRSEGVASWAGLGWDAGRSTAGPAAQQLEKDTVGGAAATQGR